MTDTDGSYRTQVSQHYGSLEALASLRPGNGLEQALHGNYHANNGNTHAGLAEWVADNPPEPQV